MMIFGWVLFIVPSQLLINKNTLSVFFVDRYTHGYAMGLLTVNEKRKGGGSRRRKRKGCGCFLC